VHASTIRQNKRYMAEIKLNFVERIASNATIAERLRNVGFVDVTVSGSGSDRIAEGTWPLSDATVELPTQIKSVKEFA
jgi:hypothetical protein